MFVNFSLADFSIFFINFSFLAVCLLFKSFAVLTSSLYLHLLTGSSGVDMKPIALQAGTKHVSTVLSLKDYRGCHGSKFHLKLLGDGVLLRTLWWQGQLKSSEVIQNTDHNHCTFWNPDTWPTALVWNLGYAYLVISEFYCDEPFVRVQGQALSSFLRFSHLNQIIPLSWL